MLFELLNEQCLDPRIGVLQTDVFNLFIKSGPASSSCTAFFYTEEEIDDGCVTGPSIPFYALVDNSELLDELQLLLAWLRTGDASTVAVEKQKLSAHRGN